MMALMAGPINAGMYTGWAGNNRVQLYQCTPAAPYYRTGNPVCLPLLSSVSPSHDPHCPCQTYSAYPEGFSNALFHPLTSLEFPNDIIPPLTPQLVFALSATKKSAICLDYINLLNAIDLQHPSSHLSDLFSTSHTPLVA